MVEKEFDGDDKKQRNLIVIIIVYHITSNIYRLIFISIRCRAFVENNCSFDTNVLKLVSQKPMLSMNLPYIITIRALVYFDWKALRSLQNFADIVTCQCLYKRLIEITEKCKLTIDFTVCLINVQRFSHLYLIFT